jgi:hypothetical protein
MRKIRDVLRLRASGLSKRKIAASLGIGATAAGDCIRRAQRAGLTEDLSEDTLEQHLYPPTNNAAKEQRPQPDWRIVHRELRRKGVTLLLWEEYRAVHPDGYGYARYVAMKIMLCKRPNTGTTASLLTNPHHITLCYSAFRNVISEGGALARRDASGNAEMSTLARAFAFISMSTSA